MKIRLTLHRKMLLYLIPASLLVFGGAIVFIVSQLRQTAYADTQRIADESAEKFAGLIKSNIDSNFDVARGVSYAMTSFYEIAMEERTHFYDQILKQTITDNPQYVSFWLNAELNFIDESFRGKTGRARYTYFRDQYKTVKYKRDSLDFDPLKINMAGDYQKMKQSKKASIMEPYFFSYTGRDEDKVLETSICVPLFKNGQFAGLVGSDIELDYFQDLIKSISIYGSGYAYLVSNQGMLIAFPDDQKVGESFSKSFSGLDTKHSITKNIEAGKRFSFKDKDPVKGTLSYVTFIPITLGNADNPWSFVVSIPYSSIKSKAQKSVLISIFVGFIGLLVLSGLIYLIAHNITIPLKSTTRVLQNLSKGDIDASDKLKIATGDEIEEMALSVNLLIDGLNRTADFAKTIGKGNLQAEYQKAGENDVLGNSLLEMRHSLIVAEEEEKKRKVEDEKMNWATQGLAKFGEILRQHNQELDVLSFNIMGNLVDYMGAIQGALFVKNDDNPDDEFYEVTGAIAYQRQKVMDGKFHLGESLVGRCAYEKMTIYMEEVPENYVQITSGLGESNPRTILLVPAILNDEVYAIIELVSFNTFEKHQIEFVEKIGESIASTLSNTKTGQRTTRLLEQSKKQAEELAAQEEEMRQNLEELQATQEEVERLRTEEQQKSRKLIQEIEKHRTALLKIIDHVPLKIFLKDHEGKMLIVNKTVLKVHNARLEDLIGKSDFDFIADYKEARKLWDAEQQIIKSGVAFHQVHTETINDTGVILDTTKHPFFIDYLNETGILGIQIDVTKEVEKDELIKKLTEELEKLKKNRS